jgi:2-phospho-L-lactate transferase/gluconeogenesis factor (CofD/UPF0052 family)
MSERRSQIRVVLFSGGSGTRSLTEAFLKHPQISLTILINAYDDGLSTGRLRKFIPSMLGPSDVRKNINRLMPVTERSQKALKTLSDHRLPVGISKDAALSILQSFVEGRCDRLPNQLAAGVSQMNVQQERTTRSYISSFLTYFQDQEQIGRTFDFTDCAVGNILFAGCYLQEGQDFNRTIAAFCRLYEVPPDSLLNITMGENLFLVAKIEDGTTLRSEAEIVGAQSGSKISELFLLDSGIYRERVDDPHEEPAAGWINLFRQAHRTPCINPAADRAIREADVIIYGPGTQHSSLLPSYLTDGVAEGIMANSGADKIFVGNIHRDNDIQKEDAGDLARKFLNAMCRKGQIAAQWADLVTQFFLQASDFGHTAPSHTYFPFNPGRFDLPLDVVRLKDWESLDGRHDGHYLLNELQQIVQSHIDIELEHLQYMVSIIIPALNEEKTIEHVLKSVVALDFQPLGLSKEVIVVDGGSSDRTASIARSVRAVKVVQLPKPLGRGAALRLGIERARGSIIAFFPADDEYDPNDLYQLVVALTHSGVRAVFGSRAVKCIQLSEDLKRIYEKQWWPYLVSKYGGMLLSILTLLFYNRYVTDVLSSVKVFDAGMLRSLLLGSKGREIDTEIVAKLCQRHEYMLELPVAYRPRTRAAGKKITMIDGIRSVLALFQYKAWTNDAPQPQRLPSQAAARRVTS